MQKLDQTLGSFGAQGNRSIPHTLERKKIWKGRVAPLGHLFLVVRIKHGKQKCFSALLIKGGANPKEEKELGQKMAKGLIDKYKLR
jgi:hypothetical protein